MFNGWQCCYNTFLLGMIWNHPTERLPFYLNQAHFISILIKLLEKDATLIMQKNISYIYVYIYMYIYMYIYIDSWFDLGS